jgi:hypothetical protein
VSVGTGRNGQSEQGEYTSSLASKILQGFVDPCNSIEPTIQLLFQLPVPVDYEREDKDNEPPPLLFSRKEDERDEGDEPDLDQFGQLSNLVHQEEVFSFNEEQDFLRSLVRLERLNSELAERFRRSLALVVHGTRAAASRDGAADRNPAPLSTERGSGCLRLGTLRSPSEGSTITVKRKFPLGQVHARRTCSKRAYFMGAAGG